MNSAVFTSLIPVILFIAIGFYVGRRGWIRAERDIKAGSEIFVSYGAEYWKDIRYNIKLDEERKKEAQKAKRS